MSVNRFAVMGLLLISAGLCSAAQPVSRGVIQFHGSIVEPACVVNAGAGSVMQLKGCPQASRASLVDVRPVGSVKAQGQSGANIKLMTDSGAAGRYYDQAYGVVDAAGVPVRSGQYLITLTSP